MNIKLLIPALGLAALIGAGTLGIKAVSAEESVSYPPFIQDLVEKFNLNEEEVKTFFEERRQEREQQMLQNREERLNQAVEDGVITEEQKQALLDKWEEMRAERQQHREEMQAWFEEHGIDPEALREYGFGHRGSGYRLKKPLAQ